MQARRDRAKRGDQSRRSRSSGLSGLILHIGSPKTGTTSIQRFFFRNRESLERQGVLYPGELGTTHVKLAYAASSGRLRGDLERRLAIDDPAACEADMRALVEGWARRRETTLLSSEFFFEMDDAAAIGRVAELFSAFDGVRALIYLRPQTQMYLSEISQRVKSGQYREADVTHFSPARYDYFRRLAAWATVFGRDRLIVRNVAALPGGNVVDDVFDILGIERSGEGDAQENRSLDACKIALLLRFNAIASGRDDFTDIRRKFVTFLERLPALAPGLRLPSGRVRWIAETMAKSNSELAEAFGMPPLVLAEQDRTVGDVSLDPGWDMDAIAGATPLIREKLDDLGLSDREVGRVLGTA